MRHSRSVFAFLLALFAAPEPQAAAQVGPTGLEAAYQGVIVSTYPDGRTARLWLSPDGTFKGTGRSGRRNAGRWSVKGERMCLKQSRPIPMPITYCTAMVEGGFGTTWTGKAVTGEPIRIELHEGR